MIGTKEISEGLPVCRPLSFEGDQWIFSVSHLVVPLGIGITTQLRKENSGYSSEIWLDWHNILHQPQNARMLVLVGLFVYENKDWGRSLPESFSRTGNILQSIAIYENIIMQQRKSEYTYMEIREMLQNGHLPRPETVFIDADRPGLDQFFEQEGFTRGGYYGGAYQVPWSRLVMMAQEGRFPLF